MKHSTTSLAPAAAAVSMLLAGVPAHAQFLDYHSFEALFGEAVTASVTGSPQRASQVPATMTIVSAEEIRRSGAASIPDLLRRYAGLDVLRWGADNADVGIRGYNQAFSPRLLVLVNGRQVYADHYGFTPWPAVPVELDAIHQIEIVRGPSSALFGFNAVSGVVNIITDDPLYEDRRVAKVSAGTQGRLDASAVTTLDISDDAAILLSAGSRRGDDFTAPVPGLADNERDAFTADFRWRARDDLQVGLEATYGASSYLEFGPSYSWSYAEYVARSLKGEISADTSHGLVHASLYHNELDAYIGLFDGITPDVDMRNDVTVASVSDVFKIGTDHTLRASAEYRRNSMDTAPVSGGEVEYDVWALGGMWEWALSESLTWTNAVRFDRLSLSRSGTFPPGYAFVNEDWDRSITETSFNTGLVWQLNDIDSLRFVVGRGVQLPSLFNFGGGLFVFPPGVFAGGTPDLEPATVSNLEIGWDRIVEPLDGTLRLAAYRGASRHVNSLVGGSDFARAIVSQAANIGDSDAVGFEAEIAGAPEGGWRWSASYSFEQITDDFGPAFPLPATLVDFENTHPEHVLRGSLGWTRGPWEVDAYAHYQSRSGSIAADINLGIAEVVPLDDFLTVDARVGYRVADRFLVSMSAQNLNHDELRETSQPHVERRVIASVTIDF